MDEMYTSGTYLAANPTWHEEDAGWKAQQILRMIEANGLAPRTVCEVGCGTGEILITLAGALPEARLAGYEISPQAHELWLRKPMRERIDFKLGDVFAMSPPRFDLVLVIDVIEHVEDFLGFIKGVRKLGALTMFHIPLDLSLQSLLRMWPLLALRRDVGHIHYFTKDLALSALTDCGYEVLDVRYTPSRLELPRQALSSRLMKLPRRFLFGLHPDLTVRVLGGYSLLVLAR